MTMRKKYPDRSRSEVERRRMSIVALSREGVTVDEIARRVGVAKCTVIQVRKEFGVSKYSVRAFTPDEDARILSLLEGGASYKEVSRTVGRSRQTLARRFPGFAWSMTERDEYTRNLRMFNLLSQADGTTGLSWHKTEKKQSRTVAESAASHDATAGQPDVADRIRTLAAQEDIEFVVSYCDQCRMNNHSPVLGVFTTWGEAELYSEGHRDFMARTADEHSPYVYDLLALPGFAPVEDVIERLSQHNKKWIRLIQENAA